jgi:hypothetical protein
MKPTMSRDGKPSKKLTLVYENINNEEFIEYSNQRCTKFYYPQLYIKVVGKAIQNFYTFLPQKGYGVHCELC